MTQHSEFDLAVIGSGPGGQKAAIMAAKLGHKVCVIDRKAMVGGVCVNTGTIPSKTLREAVMYLTGMQQRDLYGASYRVKEDITISDLLARLQHVVGREVEVVRAQLLRNHIELLPGSVLAGIGFAVAGVLGRIVLPEVLATSAQRFGVLGMAFSYVGWLFSLMCVLLIAATIGRVVRLTISGQAWRRSVALPRAEATVLGGNATTRT